MESSLKLLDGFSFSFGFDLIELDLTLGTSLESSDHLSELLVLVEVSSEGRCEVVQLGFVFLSDLGQGKDGGVLLVDELSEGSFSLNKAVRDVHLSAEGGEPDDEFDGVDVVSDDNEFGLFVLNELGDMVQAELDVIRLGVLDLFLLVKEYILSALNLASATNRALRCLASSGEYFFNNLNKTFAELYILYSDSYQELLRTEQLLEEL